MNIHYKLSVKHTANCTLTNFGPHPGIVTTDNWRLYGSKSGSLLSNTGCYQVQSEFSQTGVLKSSQHMSTQIAKEEKPSNLPIASVSEPIEILSPSSNSHQDMESLAELVRSQSLEEKRSRSLEDKPAEPKVDRHDLYDRHYLTVHLPLASDKRRNSCSSLFYLNPETLKENYIIQREVNMCRSRSASSWGSNTAGRGHGHCSTHCPLCGPQQLNDVLTLQELACCLYRYKGQACPLPLMFFSRKMTVDVKCMA
uniref:Uncharacterized protein n=1 Tax=Magallana gigas TaxID=29159 RepID=A0A8W8J6S7_MAGGI